MPSHFLEVTHVDFHIEVERLNISEIKSLHLNCCVQVSNFVPLFTQS